MSAAPQKSFSDTLDRAKHELANHDASKFSDEAIETVGEIACDQLSYILREALQAGRDEGSEVVLVKHIQIAFGRLALRQRKKTPKIAVLIGTTLISGGVGIVLQPGIGDYSRADWYLSGAALLICMGIYAVAWGFKSE